MKLRQTLLAGVAMLSAVCMNLSFAQSDRVTVEFIVQDNGGKIDTLIFGVGKGATYCIDAAFGEVEQPPKPPTGVFDARFVDNRTGGGACLGQGLVTNYQNWFTTAVIETARVSFQPGDGGYPFTFTWPAGLSTHFNTLTLKSNEGTVDMLTETTTQITDPDVITARIIATAKPNAVDREGELFPQEFGLQQNFPNPFNPTTTVKFSIEKRAFAEIAVYDILGQKVSTLVSEDLTPGYYNVTWNGTNERGMAVATGAYYIRMNASFQNSEGQNEQFTELRKILLMK